MYLCCNKVNSCVRLKSACLSLLVFKDNRMATIKLIFPQLMKKFIRILRNPKFHHRVHNSPSLVPVKGQMNPVYPVRRIQLFVEQICIGHVD